MRSSQCCSGSSSLRLSGTSDIRPGIDTGNGTEAMDDFVCPVLEAGRAVAEHDELWALDFWTELSDRSIRADIRDIMQALEQAFDRHGIAPTLMPGPLVVRRCMRMQHRHQETYSAVVR